ncbi:MAG: hypothetical protein JWL70_2837 [Acidimicrobiia bacterium]|nr:hypothetical protein [Acidimicrobiia bacterium]
MPRVVHSTSCGDCKRVSRPSSRSVYVAPIMSTTPGSDQAASHQRVVTVSATYGSGGSVIAPALARRLGLAFLDRLVPLTDVTVIAALSEQLTPEERAQSPMSRFLGHLVRASTVLGAPASALQDVQPPEAARYELEESVIRATAGGAVVLGRAAALVLQKRPGVFNVRLDGPPERRVVRAMSLEQVDEATALARLHDADRTRAQVVKRLFDRDSADPSLYQLVLDPTVFSMDDAVELLATAAEVYWRQPLH